MILHPIQHYRLNDSSVYRIMYQNYFSINYFESYLVRGEFGFELILWKADKISPNLWRNRGTIGCSLPAIYSVTNLIHVPSKRLLLYKADSFFIHSTEITHKELIFALPKDFDHGYPLSS